MTMILYYGSGSPYAWRAQLALECKALPYERKVLSFSAGDTTKPEFIALNPRHRVPTLVDGDFVLYESNAIVEYLDDAYPGRGAPLFRGDARQRATVRRLMCEVDNYVDKAVDIVVDEGLGKKPEERDAARLAKGKADVREEFAQMSRYLRGDFLVGALSAADFWLYTEVAFIYRIQAKRLPDLGADSLLTPELRAWKERVESLPYFDRTIPPHWKENP